MKPKRQTLIHCNKVEKCLQISMEVEGCVKIMSEIARVAALQIFFGSCRDTFLCCDEANIGKVQITFWQHNFEDSGKKIFTGEISDILYDKRKPG